MRVLPSEILNRIKQRLEKLYGAAAAPRLIDRLVVLVGHCLDTSEYLVAPEAQWDQRDCVLITYADMIQSAEEPPLIALHRFLAQHLRGSLRTVHILPFFPFSSDEGFSVIDYRKVDPALGTWEDIEAIGHDFHLMVDLVLNHSSRRSAWFKDYINGIAPARGYFIAVEPSTDLTAVVRPRSTPLLTTVQTRQGERHVWTTFSDDQVDLNFANPDVLFEFLDILLSYVAHGARIIRLDAIAYLWKRPGTACINLPETHEVVKLFRDVLDMVAPGVVLLTETNLPHEQNVSYFGDGDEAHMVYQFSLPPLLLHALHTGSTGYLQQWAASVSSPPPQCTYLNFTASHDGIGIRPLEGLMPESEIATLVEAIRRRGGHVSWRRTENGTESPYELNITYFDALSDAGHVVTQRHIDRFLCSQTVMLALQGVPAVYFHALTATPNDHVGVDRTGHARAINRKRWDETQLTRLLDDPATPCSQVFHGYVKLLSVRKQHVAFHPDGQQRVLKTDDGVFGIERVSPDQSERIVALSNLSKEHRRVGLDDLLEHSASAREWTELIQGRALEASDDALVELAPYQSVWLSPSD